jgi:hypothetical protein
VSAREIPRHEPLAEVERDVFLAAQTHTVHELDHEFAGRLQRCRFHRAEQRVREAQRTCEP